MFFAFRIILCWFCVKVEEARAASERRHSAAVHAG